MFKYNTIHSFSLCIWGGHLIFPLQVYSAFLTVELARSSDGT